MYAKLLCMLIFKKLTRIASPLILCGVASEQTKNPALDCLIAAFDAVAELILAHFASDRGCQDLHAYMAPMRFHRILQQSKVSCATVSYQMRILKFDQEFPS